MLKARRRVRVDAILESRRPQRAARVKFNSTFGRLSRRFERIFAVIAIITLAGGAAGLSRSGLAFDYDDDPITRALLPLSYLISGLICLAHPAQTIKALVRNPAIILLVPLAFVSMAWSIDPDETFSRSIGLAGATVVGLFLAIRFSKTEAVSLIAWGFGITAVASILVAVFVPGVGVHSSADGAQWRGLFSHKNTLARVMTLTIAVFVVLAYHQKGIRRWALLAISAMGVVLLVKTGSATALVVAALLLGSIPLFIGLRAASVLAIPVGLGGLVLVGVLGNAVAVNQDNILRALGRDPSLTGRTALWEATSYYVADRPWLGHGFAAFWREGSVTKVEIRHAVRWKAPHSHNGFRDLTLDLGYIGLALFVVGFLTAFARGLVTLRTEEAAAALWPVTFLSFMVLYNASESTLLRASSVFWALLIATACAPIARSSRARRRPAQARRPATFPSSANSRSQTLLS